MSSLKRRQLPSEARRVNADQLARAGAAVREGRVRRRWTQAGLARRVGLHQTTISRMERGIGGSLSVDAWQRVALALDLRLRLEPPRDPLEEPADAGHLAIQELVLRVGRRAGYDGRFELPTRPRDPARSVDVGLVHRRRRLLVLVECVNTIRDIGAAARSSERKRAELEDLAAVQGDAFDANRYRDGVCWVIRATRANRALLARYPLVFAARFPGSSRAWVRTLTTAEPPPEGPGLVWCDVSAQRLIALRLQRADRDP